MGKLKPPDNRNFKKSIQVENTPVSQNKTQNSLIKMLFCMEFSGGRPSL